MHNHVRHNRPIRIAVAVVSVVAGATAIAIPVLPAQATCHPVGPAAYVSGGGDSFKELVTINNCGQVTGSVNIGTQNGRVALSPGGATAYVTTGASVLVIDTATEKVIDTIPVAGADIAVSPNGAHVYVTSGSGNTVSVIDTATNMLADTITVGNDPLGVAVSPDSLWVYVVNQGDDTVSVIGAETDQVIATIGGVGIEPSAIVLSPDGATAYIYEPRSAISVINTGTDSVTGTIAIGNGLASGLPPFRFAVTPDGGTLYVSDYTGPDDLIAVVDTVTGMQTTEINVGSEPEAVAVTADGVFAYAVTDAGPLDTEEINTNAGTVFTKINAGGLPFDVATVPPAPTKLKMRWLHGLSCTAATFCLAVGTQETPTGTTGLALVRSGGLWHLTEPLGLAGSTGDTVYQVACSSRTDCMAVGGAQVRPAVGGPARPAPLAALWNGATWTASTPPVPAGSQDGVLRDVSCESRQCLAVGSVRDSAGAAVPLTERWTGSTWQPLPTPDAPGARSAQLTSVSCKRSDCSAVGAYLTASSGWKPLAETWNGTSWRETPTAPPTGHRRFVPVQSVACATSARCVLVGNTESAGHAVPFSEQFVGGRWHLLTAAAKAPPNAELVSVSCPAVNRCIATGGATTHSGRQVPLAEEWNGTKWRVLTLAGPLSPSLSVLDHVSCTGPNACLAVGNVGMRTLAEIWNGSRWRILATPG